MYELFNARRKFGSCYLTVFEDGLEVPWHPLSMGDYIKYTHDYGRSIIPNCLIEDEIFRKCVTDETIVSQMSFLKAGVITTVALNVWQYSGPVGIPEFNNDLETARHLLFNSPLRALHELVQVISMAFPYKPEEIYDMDYETFMFRLAQAEKKLIDLKIINEPISLQGPPENTDKKTPPEKPRIDAKHLWEEQEGITPPQVPKAQQKSSQRSTEISRERWWDVSPVLEAKNKKKIKMDFGEEEAMSNDLALDSDERASPKEVREFISKKRTENDRKKMIEEAQVVYADLLKEMRKRKK